MRHIIRSWPLAILPVALAGAVSAQTPARAPAPPPPAATADEITTVAPLIIHGGVAVPRVGEGAALLSPTEIHDKGTRARDLRSTFEDGRATLYNCYTAVFGTPPNPERTIGYEEGTDAGRKLSNWSRLAEEATVNAQRVRAAAAGGEATPADVEAAERERQRTVIEVTKAELDLDEALQKAIDIQELVKDRTDIAGWNGMIYANAAERADRKNALVPKQFEDLQLKDVKAVERTDDKGQAYLFVTGAIRNTRKTRIAVPPLSFTAVDQFGYPLLNEAGEARGRIDAGKDQPFTYTLRPSPRNAARVVVTFAGLKRPSHLDPVETDPVCQYSPQSPYAQNEVPSDIQALDPRASGSSFRALPSASAFITSPRNAINNQ